jgi:isopentenyldiphosphate isomerase
MPLDDNTETFIWVDEHDNKLGTITRGQAHDGSGKIHRAVMTLVFNETKTKILFQKRSALKDLNPGKWSCGVGGHLEPDESYEQAIKRELLEEMGVVAMSLTSHMTKLYDLGYEREFMATFEARISDSQLIQFDPTEVEQIVWCDLEKIDAFVASHEMSPGIADLLSEMGYLS